MGSKNTYYKRKKEILQQKARNHYHQICGKEKTKYVLKKTEKYCKSMHKINIEN